MASKIFVCPRCGERFDVGYISVGHDAIERRDLIIRKFVPTDVDYDALTEDMMIEDAIVPCIKCGLHIDTVRRVHGFRIKNKNTGEIYYNDID